MIPDNLLQAVAVFGVFFVASVVIDKALKNIEARFDSAASESFRLMSNSQKAILLFIGLVLALSKLGFDVAGVVAGLGLTGFALGFALKDAISNLVAGIMIILYKPIRLGQTIELAGSKGKVIDINLRYVTIKDEAATHLICIPSLPPPLGFFPFTRSSCADLRRVGHIPHSSLRRNSLIPLR